MAANSPPPPSPSPSSQPPRRPVPASPTCSYASTANPLSRLSQFTFPAAPRPAHAVLTKADLQSSQAAYADLLGSAKALRVALSGLGLSAAAFGSALEACARLKEARADALLGPSADGASLANSFHAAGVSTADNLLTVAGLQHLLANHGQILAEMVYTAFELPLLHELDRWRTVVEDEQAAYKRAVGTQSREIQKLEEDGLRMYRQQRRRDVAQYRSHLVAMTQNLDGLTATHAEHARTLLRESQDTSATILDASCSLARAEVDIFESLARKGWTGGGLEEVLEKGRDLFASEDATGVGRGGGTAGAASAHGGSVAGGSGDGSKLFSILPPKSILAESCPSDTSRPGHGRPDSLLVDADRYQSLAGQVHHPLHLHRDDLCTGLENGTGPSETASPRSDPGASPQVQQSDGEEATRRKDEGHESHNRTDGGGAPEDHAPPDSSHPRERRRSSATHRDLGP